MKTKKKNKFSDEALKDRLCKLIYILQALPSAGTVITSLPVLRGTVGVGQAYERLARHILNAPIGLPEC